LAPRVARLVGLARPFAEIQRRVNAQACQAIAARPAGPTG
jgi:hypothetical protein